MNTLSVWRFPTVDGAARALRTLETEQTRRRLTIADSAVVEWPPADRRPTAYQAGTVDGATTLSGAFWGLLIGTLFLAPLAGLTGPAWPPDGLARIGLPEGLLDQIRDNVHPGSSALFVLGTDTATERLRKLLPTPPLTSVLGPDQEAALHLAFGSEEWAHHA